MRLGLLGDIHGNVLALAAVLRAAKENGMDALCLTGDFVGYYYEPDAVFELLSEWTRYAVRGNHEDMLLECLNDPAAADRCRRRYGAGIDHAIQRLSPADIDMIARLPRSLRLKFGGKSLLLAHGAPWDTDCYMYATASATLWDRLGEAGTDYVVLGHTHHRLIRQIGMTRVINPGSVGQPRDRRPGAAWAILDTVTDEVEHRTELYDIARVAEQARTIDPELPYLWEVLVRQ